MKIRLLSLKGITGLINPFLSLTMNRVSVCFQFSFRQPFSRYLTTTMPSPPFNLLMKYQGKIPWR